MGVPTLPYYLKIFKLFLLLIFTYVFFIFIFKDIAEQNSIINIKKGSNIDIISNNIFDDNNKFDKIIYKNSLKLINFFKVIHYGNFKIQNDINFIQLINLITNTSNINNKITIIGGWQKFEISNYLLNYFKNIKKINYEDILADTYLIKDSNSFQTFLDLNEKAINELFDEYSESLLLNKFNRKEIMIIASLVEKEAFDDMDKKIVASVILNRLKLKMKLQIDASVIFSITKGDYKLKRKLSRKDLKIKDIYNTYYIKGLPPGLISVVEKKTIELVLENYKTNYLFYFYDSFKKKHIYSENFNDHKRKLNEYRKKSQ